MADFTTCVSRSSMRKLRSPNQKTTLWEKDSFHEFEQVHVYKCSCNANCRSWDCSQEIIWKLQGVFLYSICVYVCVLLYFCAYSWSRTPVAAWPSNCCCCRMLSKSSMRWSEFSMCAGRWQFRKQMVWPNTDILALTPPLFPCNIHNRLNYIREENIHLQNRCFCIQLSTGSLPGKLSRWYNLIWDDKFLYTSVCTCLVLQSWGMCLSHSETGSFLIRESESH